MTSTAKQAADANAAAWAAYYSQYYGGQQNQSNQSSAPTNNQPQPNASQPTSGPAAGKESPVVSDFLNHLDLGDATIVSRRNKACESGDVKVEGKFC